MTRRIDYRNTAPDAMRAMRAMRGLERYAEEGEIEPGLRELVKMRASQINGCAYCLDMHSKDARARGETEQRLYALSVWRESPFYTARERAALAWTEAVTRISEGVDEALYASVLEHFSEKELVDLTMVVVAINGWNRLAISLGSDVGSYRPTSQEAPTVGATRG